MKRHQWGRINCLNSDVKYTDMAVETDESVLCIEVSSIQRCPYMD